MTIGIIKQFEILFKTYLSKHISLKNTRVVKIDKKRVRLCFEMYERTIIIIFYLWLLIIVELRIIFAFFICI